MGVMTRTLQRAKEVGGKAHTTTYTAEFEELVQQVEAVKMHTVKLADKLEDSLKMFGSGMTKSECCAEPASQLHRRLTNAADYQTVLAAFATEHTSVGKAERQFVKDVRERVILPLKQWVKDSYGEITRAREALNKRRLDMDAAYQKNTKNNNDLNQSNYDTAQANHDEAYEKVKGLVERLPEHLDSHKEILKTYVSIHKDYYAACFEAADTSFKSI